jgi:hypothetical protein
MADATGSTFYVLRAPELVDDFERAAQHWRGELSTQYGSALADTVLRRARAEFERLLPEVPYIGGDENPLTASLVGSVECLAVYRAMLLQGLDAAATGKVLYDAVAARIGREGRKSTAIDDPSRESRMDWRRQRALRSQDRRFPMDYVYFFVEGDGITFDYGYDFVECASDKFYRGQGASAFLPFYCFLDFPKCELGGLGLSRTSTLGEGGTVCDFRFREGGRATRVWPPALALPGRGARHKGRR